MPLVSRLRDRSRADNDVLPRAGVLPIHKLYHSRYNLSFPDEPFEETLVFVSQPLIPAVRQCLNDTVATALQFRDLGFDRILFLPKAEQNILLTV